MSYIDYKDLTIEQYANLSIAEYASLAIDVIPPTGPPAAPVLPLPVTAYPEQATIELAPADDTGTVWYTLDGTEPVPGRCRRYDGAFVIGGSARVRAVTVIDGVAGQEASSFYGINTAMPRRPSRGADPYAAGEFVEPVLSDSPAAPVAPPAAPTMLPERPRFNGSVTVTLAAAEEDSVLYYTTDGSPPSSRPPSQRYTDPFTLQRSTVVRAVAVSPDGEQSEETHRRFLK